jgi:hypothetical protein
MKQISSYNTLPTIPERGVTGAIFYLYFYILKYGYKVKEQCIYKGMPAIVLEKNNSTRTVWMP